MTDGGSVESLLDILELIDRIQRQTSGLDRESFLLDADVQDATAYRILAIGEASRDLYRRPQGAPSGRAVARHSRHAQPARA